MVGCNTCKSFAFAAFADYGRRMTETVQLPLTYLQWHQCITQKCRIKLTREYLEARIASIGDTTTDESRNFRRLYGEAHFQAVRRWFQRALDELPPQTN